jgi:hypothetical protein
MNKILLLSFIFLLSCKDSHTPVEPKINVTDTILEKSKKTVIESEVLQKKTNKVISKVFEKIMLEKISMTKQLNTAKTRVDTVYIETKKNFWGKTKKTITTKSDSTESITIDSTTKVSVDTLRN